MDKMDEEIDGTEEQDHTEPAEPVKPKLSRIQKAYLAFCITLLNQSITRKEYDSPLVYALAVLDVKENG
jgi:hypothetical protein